MHFVYTILYLPFTLFFNLFVTIGDSNVVPSLKMNNNYPILGFGDFLPMTSQASLSQLQTTMMDLPITTGYSGSSGYNNSISGNGGNTIDFAQNAGTGYVTGSSGRFYPPGSFDPPSLSMSRLDDDHGSRYHKRSSSYAMGTGNGKPLVVYENDIRASGGEMSRRYDYPPSPKSSSSSLPSAPVMPDFPTLNLLTQNNQIYPDSINHPPTPLPMNYYPNEYSNRGWNEHGEINNSSLYSSPVAERTTRYEKQAEDRVRRESISEGRERTRSAMEVIG